MTRLLSIAFAISTLLFLSACGDDEASISEPSLDGEWNLTALTTETESTVDFLGTPFTTAGVVEGSNFDYVITFNDGQYSASGSYDAEVTTTLNGVPFLTQTQTVDAGTISATYSVDGNTITFDNDAFEVDLEEYDIEQFDENQVFTFEFDGDNTVILTLDQTFAVQDEESGQTIDLDIEMELVLERQ